MNEIKNVKFISDTNNEGQYVDNLINEKATESSDEKNIFKNSESSLILTTSIKQLLKD